MAKDSKVWVSVRDWAKMLAEQGVIDDPRMVERVTITIDARDGCRIRIDRFVSEQQISALMNFTRDAVSEEGAPDGAVDL